MARYLTARDHTVRARWASFLEPFVGDERPIPAAALAKAISANTTRCGDATWQVRNWINGDRTVSPFLAFEAGEALRACGIAWSTGLGALWVAGYLGEYARRVANLAQDTPHLPELAVTIGAFAPLFAGPSLHGDPEGMDEGRRLLASFACHLPVGPRDEAARRKRRRALPGDELLVHAAQIGDARNVEFEMRERTVLMLVVEWAINAASPWRREGRLADISDLLGPRLGQLMQLLEARAAAFAHVEDRLVREAVESGRMQHDPRTSASRTGRKKA